MNVNVLEAKNRWSELIRRATAGEEVVVANRGRPVARLVAEPEANARDAAGDPRALLDGLEQNPLPACAQRTAAEIDADILEERRGWD